jgi:hypothetical protein
MTFRAANQKYVEPIAQWTMIFGIIALCQPWIKWLHEWSVTIMLIGFIAFIVSIHIPPPARQADEESDDTGPVSVKAAVRGEHG